MVAWHDCATPWLLAQVPGATHKAMYVCAYLHWSRHSCATWAQAIEELDTALTEVRETTRHVILGGDVNLSNLDDGELAARAGVSEGPTRPIAEHAGLPPPQTAQPAELHIRPL